MGHYQAGYSFSPLAIAFTFAHHGPMPPNPQPWQWSYTFKDGSQLRGTFHGTVAEELVSDNAIPTFQVQGVGLTEYLMANGKTPLLVWQPGQFNCFEVGENLLLMASSDNYVGNSLCLVNSLQRQWAQITHWGSRLVAEPLVWERFSLHCLTGNVTTITWSLGWEFSPFLPPLFHWHFRSWPPTAHCEGGSLRDRQPNFFFGKNICSF